MSEPGGAPGRPARAAGPSTLGPLEGGSCDELEALVESCPCSRGLLAKCLSPGALHCLRIGLAVGRRHQHGPGALGSDLETLLVAGGSPSMRELHRGIQLQEVSLPGLDLGVTNPGANFGTIALVAPLEREGHPSRSTEWMTVIKRAETTCQINSGLPSTRRGRG